MNEHLTKKQIIDLDEALIKDKVSQGAVYINEKPQVRSGKRNDFMVGRFLCNGQSVEFKIWDIRTFQVVLDNGVGVYWADVIGSEFNGEYLTVRRILKNQDPEISKADFLTSIPLTLFEDCKKDAYEAMRLLGVSDKAFELADLLLDAPELQGRFWKEGAAIYHHDNQIRGLAYHTLKMLRILSAVVATQPLLLDHVDLLTVGILIHDIGKVWEYDYLTPSEYWYANHRARGIEYLASKKDLILKFYDESFYRQLQAIIIGHHGDYGDRPETVATAIIHYIDTLESQTTGLLTELARSKDDKIHRKDWGFLAGF